MQYKTTASAARICLIRQGTVRNLAAWRLVDRKAVVHRPTGYAFRLHDRPGTDYDRPLSLTDFYVREVRMGFRYVTTDEAVIMALYFMGFVELKSTSSPAHDDDMPF